MIGIFRYERAVHIRNNKFYHSETPFKRMNGGFYGRIYGLYTKIGECVKDKHKIGGIKIN